MLCTQSLHHSLPVPSPFPRVFPRVFPCAMHRALSLPPLHLSLSKERFEITQDDLARETGLPHRQGIGLWMRGSKLAQGAVILAGSVVATWCRRFKNHKLGQARPLPQKASMRARDVQSVQDLMDRLAMTIFDVATECGIPRCEEGRGGEMKREGREKVNNKEQGGGRR